MLKQLLFYAIVIAVIGAAVLTAMGKIPFLGHLPGDCTFSHANMRIRVPFTTMALFFIVLIAVYKIFSRKE
ncbi:MAG: hypothetical protein A2268_02575 [Candidatus Raymondbacteria bacterium RifOxyA12_full_50_37]|uniref:DUF2905 domain-containing protein n=1 Tax=Candidatus Raymondbacteria bacterium RIFOXYD12_FULL_49_13 TaxID=1817890 RepID=A0A1F7F5T6_UNCRA|nr:MAG: hypothetical protein A2268_02575 [Candidatus Raymondbacteria bacterium RifOxyA12_full_50_37]OGJ89153.1 MAG: hypothetical protein A2248_11395 [Candidatus Raymondbacteria bacterium RIFOXYA2_FULL_49_16]OGJ96635.1 MAG: hypothetical protein A2453_06510 [Candidatus Raymondbacteria bacterium RIFOXYC2_FULL_50_21]OGJ97163.1 MAG: hypothetical protein A2487_17615 [Candidatus Raymondbacteria bacterium RifOxyC12_full_50_8]OGK01948.1 MAG: hypothetical protein A2519_17615 [Candidatus Raymondbacteria b